FTRTATCYAAATKPGRRRVHNRRAGACRREFPYAPARWLATGRDFIRLGIARIADQLSLVAVDADSADRSLLGVDRHAGLIGCMQPRTVYGQQYAYCNCDCHRRGNFDPSAAQVSATAAQRGESLSGTRRIAFTATHADYVGLYYRCGR